MLLLFCLSRVILFECVFVTRVRLAGIRKQKVQLDSSLASRSLDIPEATNNFCTQEYLEEHDTIDFNSFVEKVWPNVREIYKSKEKAAEVMSHIIIQHW